MSAINTGKVIVGGVVAGVVMTLVDIVVTGGLLASRWNAAMERLGLPPFDEGGPTDLATLIGTNIILGLLLAFVYAAIRPRFGPGPKTAVVAGLLVALPPILTVLSMSTMDVFEMSMVGTFALSTLIVVCAGALVAGWIYKEA